MRQPHHPTATEEQILSLERIFQCFREESNFDALIATTVAFLQEQFEYSLIWIALYDHRNHILNGKGGVTPGSDINYLKQQVVLSPGDLLEQVVIEQRPLGVTDLRTENRAEGWQQLAQKFNIQGTVIIPICHKDRCLGLALLGSQRWGYLMNGVTRASLMMVLGELGAVISEIDMNLQRKQTKRFDEPLLQLLENLQTLTNLEQRLEAVAEATHQFVLPTRTKIYWFEREGRYFWQRVSNRSANRGILQKTQETVVKFTVHELSDFYFSLAVNEIVCIGEGRSSLQSNFTMKLLQRLQVRSLLAAPIIWQKDLLGFLAVENTKMRIWSEADLNFVKGAAGLISLVMPIEQTESAIQKIQDHAYLTSQIAQGIYSDYDVQEILETCATKVLQRLAATRFLLLQYDSDKNNYQIFYQNQPHNRRPMTFAFDALKEVDWQLLLHSSESVAIENIDEDLRFFNWHSSLKENRVRSLVICNCALGHPPKALLVIATEEYHSWTSLEKELVQIVSQQIGVIIRQWQLHNQTEQQQKIVQSFQQCLRIIEDSQNAKTHPLKHLEQTALEQIASILNCSLAILITWQPGENLAKIVPGVIATSLFEIAADTLLPFQTEALIQWALITDGLLSLTVDDLPSTTREWLHGAGIGQILIMALHTSADYQPTGIIVLADYLERQWAEDYLKATETLVCQLAWSRRWLQITQLLQLQNEELRQLNWYKHRRLEDLQKMVTLLLSQAQNIGIPAHEITQTRFHKVLWQLENTNTSIQSLLQLEMWQLQINQESLPIASLLKRSLERIDSVIKKQKLWVGVHGLGQQKEQESEQNSSMLSQTSLAITGDIARIELIIQELLLIACDRSKVGGRVDIWCRRLDENFLEVSFTDNGLIEPDVLTQLEQNKFKDVLTPSCLSYPPALHLMICQQLIQQMGGELHFYQLPDSRLVSRLLLSLAIKN